MNSNIKNIIPRKLGYLLKNIRLMVRGYLYKGDRYYCPICQHSFKTMLPGGFDLPVTKEKEIIGGGYRQNNICPRCQSTDRDRLVYLYLKEKTTFFTEPQQVLHVAPEQSLFRVFSKLPNLTYIVGTKYQEGFYYSDELPVIDLRALLYKNNTFDFVIANHVLEHIKEEERVLHEIFRVLKPGGSAIVQVPIANKLNKTFEDPGILTKNDREKFYGQFDHVRLYGKDYPDHLSAAGFVVTKIKPGEKHWQMSEINKFALNADEHLYIAKKTAIKP